MTTCDHEAFHTATSRYAPDRGVLRYVEVCDACGAEVRELAVVEYRPAPDPHGNDPFLARAA
jgi:hypothetical protein